jgi:cell shape-determining protein MreD
MLLPLAVVAVAVLEGGFAGAGFGLGVGLLWELAYPGGVGALIFGMALAGMLTGVVAQYALNQSFPGYFLCSAGVLAVLDGLRLLGGVVTERAPMAILLQVAVPEILVTLAWSPVVWLIFWRIYRKVGGTKLA